MIKYLKSDLFVVSKMKATYILPLIAFLMMLLTGLIYIRFNFAALGMGTYSTAMSESMHPDSSIPASESMSNSFVMGFDAGFESSESVMGVDTEEDGQAAEAEYEMPTAKSILGGGLLYESTVCDFYSVVAMSLTNSMIMGIFVALFMGNWLRAGLSKNILKGNSNRFLPFFSKILALFICCIAFNVITYVQAAICVALMGKSLVFGFSAEFVRFFIINTLLLFAFSCIVAMVTTLFKSTALGMVFGIVSGTGLISTGMMLIELLINHVILDNGKVSLTPYLISGQIASYSVDATSKDTRNAIIAIAVFLVISLVSSSLVYKKRDIH